MGLPSVTVAFALNGVVLGAVAVLAGYWWFTRSNGGTSDAAAWAADAAALASEVQQVAAVTGSVADHDRIQRQIVPLSSRVQNHARSAPAAVEASLVQRVYDLGESCYAVGMEHTRYEAARSGEFLADKLAALRDEAATLEAAIVAQFDVPARQSGVGVTLEDADSNVAGPAENQQEEADEPDADSEEHRIASGDETESDDRTADDE